MLSRLIIALLFASFASSVGGQVKVVSSGKTKTLKNDKVIAVLYKDTLYSTREFKWYGRSLNLQTIDTVMLFKEKEGITLMVTPDSVFMTASKYLFSIDSTYTKRSRKYDNSIPGGRFYTQEKLISVVVPKYKDTIYRFHRPEIMSIHTKKWNAPFGNASAFVLGGLLTTGCFVASTVNLIKGDKKKLKTTGLATLGAAAFTTYFIVELRWHRSYDLKANKWRLQ